MDVKEVVKFLKEKQGPRAQNDFAKAIGISPQYLSDVLSGRRRPGQAILDYLGLVKSYEFKRWFRIHLADCSVTFHHTIPKEDLQRCLSLQTEMNRIMAAICDTVRYRGSQGGRGRA